MTAASAERIRAAWKVTRVASPSHAPIPMEPGFMALSGLLRSVTSHGRNDVAPVSFLVAFFEEL